ncbi:MAG: hypothetical protein EB084_22485, partial [Proteobacteria bacterium]|nr:hypothetical protein [Pseudomonadota bacterium]
PASPAPTASGAPAATPSPTPASTPVPLAYVVTQTDIVSRSLAEIQMGLGTDTVTERVTRDLPLVAMAVSELLAETKAVLARTPSISSLHQLELQWVTMYNPLPGWTRALTARITTLQGNLERLSALSQTWANTEREALDSKTPPEVLVRVREVRGRIDATIRQLQRDRSEALALQSRVATQSGRIADCQALLARARDEAVTLLLVQDSPPLWAWQALLQGTGDDTLDGGAFSFFSNLESYAVRNRMAFVVHAAVIVLLLLVVAWAREQMLPRVEEEPALEGMLGAFRIPLSAAVLLSMPLTSLLYPGAPHLLRALGLAVTLLVSARVLMRVLDGPLLRILRPLFVFCAVDLVRPLLVGQPLALRLLFIAEMLCAALYATYVHARAKTLQTTDDAAVWRRVSKASRVCQALFAFALLASVAGYMALSRIVGETVLDSIYFGLVLCGIERVVEGLVIFSTRIPPLSRLAVIDNHRVALRHRLRPFLRRVIIVSWLLVVLNRLTLRRDLFSWMGKMLTTSITLGSIKLTVGGLVGFGVAVWGAFVVTRVIEIVLDEDVYPRMSLPRGLPFVISTLVRYTVLLLGFVLALGALGIDMTRFTIVVGAFSVGIGFGLQNVVNNFVSGLILLFERPANVGDVLEVNGQLGELKTIGLRASIVGVADGSEIILPNSLLVSQQVVNWTRSDQRRRIDIEIPLSYDVDPDKVTTILLETAARCPKISRETSPQVYIMKLQEDHMLFQLRVWSPQFDGGLALRSALSRDIVVALHEGGIKVRGESG